MLVPKGSSDLYSERNATAVLAVLCLSAFMAITAVLLILGYDRAPNAAVTQELPSD
jgi:hypothetical protein